MIDISGTIAPKSDQINADDLISGPLTITVTSVNLVAEDQPVSIRFAGDEGKPYKPCKSMRRVIVRAWGADAAQYAGRSMTLYLDESVRFGGAAVGGIRISHMSHIDKPLTMALTATRAVKKSYTVNPIAIVVDQQKKASESNYVPDDCTNEWLSDMSSAEKIDDLKTVFGLAYKSGRNKLEKSYYKSAYDSRMAELAAKEQKTT